jgi:hypothetical protein
MNDREAEIKFSKYRHEFHRLFHAFLGEFLTKPGATGRKLISEQDQNGHTFNAHPGHTLRGQVKVVRLGYPNRATGASEEISISIGHDKNFDPIITMHGTEAGPIDFSTTGVASTDVAAIRLRVSAFLDEA